MIPFPAEQEGWLVQIDQRLAGYLSGKKPRWSAALDVIVMSGVCTHEDVSSCNCFDGYSEPALAVRNGEWNRRVYDVVRKYDVRKIRQALLRDLRNPGKNSSGDPKYGAHVLLSYGEMLRGFFVEDPDPSWFENFEGTLLFNWGVSLQEGSNPFLTGTLEPGKDSKRVTTREICGIVRGRFVQTADTLYGLVGNPDTTYQDWYVHQKKIGDYGDVWGDEPLKQLVENGYIRL